MRDAIDFEDPEPVYQQLAGILREQIRSGKISPNKRIPSQRTLCDTYQVARGTAAKSIQVLHDEGWVITVRGKGIWTAKVLPKQ